MMMRRLLGLTVVALVLAMTGISSAQVALPPGGTFVDDNGNPHEPNIEAIAAAGITQGCDAVNRLYCPAQNVTRAEMAAFILRGLGQDAILPTFQGYFSDVPQGEWFTPYVEKLFELSISQGFPDGTYRPGNPVNRGEMSAFVLRALGQDTNLTPYRGLFADVPETAWYALLAERMHDMGITTGCANGPLRYCPDDPVKRDQMASFLARALGLQPIFPPPPTTTTTTTTTTSPPGGAGSVFWSCSSFGSSYSCSGNTDRSDFSTEFWSCSVFSSSYSCSGNIDKSDFSTEFWSCSVFSSSVSCSGNIDKSDFSTEFWSCSLFSTGSSCSGNINKADFSTEFWSCSSFGSSYSCSGNIDKSDFSSEFWSCSVFSSSWSCSGDLNWLAPVVDTAPPNS